VLNCVFLELENVDGESGAEGDLVVSVPRDCMAVPVLASGRDYFDLPHFEYTRGVFKMDTNSTSLKAFYQMKAQTAELEVEYS
jgi:hypothetical protein